MTGKTGVHWLDWRWKESGISHRRRSRERRLEFVILIGSPGDSPEAWTHPDGSVPHLMVIDLCR